MFPKLFVRILFQGYLQIAKTWDESAVFRGEIRRFSPENSTQKHLYLEFAYSFYNFVIDNLSPIKHCLPMKRLLLLCALAIPCFMACEKEDNDYLDSAIATRDIETINALVDSFDPSTINTNQLIDDLTNGTLYCTYIADFTKGEWIYHKSWEGAAPSVKLMLNTDESAFKIDWNSLELDWHQAQASWTYDHQSNQLLVREEYQDGTVVFKYTIAYYKSPYVIIDEGNNRLFRYGVNLNKTSREEFMKLYESYQ